MKYNLSKRRVIVKNPGSSCEPSFPLKTDKVNINNKQLTIDKINYTDLFLLSKILFNFIFKEHLNNLIIPNLLVFIE